MRTREDGASGMAIDNGVIDQWLDAWTQEFGRAVEMFSGQVPSITFSRSKQLAPTEMGDLLWWKQSFNLDHATSASTFCTWLGAKESTWLALGGAAGDPEAEAAKAAYLEIVGQAQHGAASVVGLHIGKTVRAGGGQLDAAPDFHSLTYALVGVQFNGVELPSLAIALEPQIAEALVSPVDEAVPATPGAAAGKDQRSHGEVVPMAPMLSRLMDLELPLSVALGRAKMPISDVLKVTAGSLIELDKNIGDQVDLIVHGTVVARGEVVSVRGNYGVRIKEIISRQDRLNLYGAQ